MFQTSDTVRERGHLENRIVTGIGSGGFDIRRHSWKTNRDKLRAKLDQLLEMQAKLLESRTFGTATDSDLFEYGLRQEVIRKICNQLAYSAKVAKWFICVTCGHLARGSGVDVAYFVDSVGSPWH